MGAEGCDGCQSALSATRSPMGPGCPACRHGMRLLSPHRWGCWPWGAPPRAAPQLWGRRGPAAPAESARRHGGASPNPCAGRRSRSSGRCCSRCRSRSLCARSSSSSEGTEVAKLSAGGWGAADPAQTTRPPQAVLPGPAPCTAFLDHEPQHRLCISVPSCTSHSKPCNLPLNCALSPRPRTSSWTMNPILDHTLHP